MTFFGRIIWLNRFLKTYNSLCRFSDLLCVAVKMFRDQMELKDFEKVSTKYHDVCVYPCPS